MRLQITVESKKVDGINKHNACEFCLLGQGMMCVSRKHCQWNSNGEIYGRKSVRKLKGKKKINLPEPHCCPVCENK